MKSNYYLDAVVGFFVVCVAFLLLSLAFKVSGIKQDVKNGYNINAYFDNVGSLRKDAVVSISGVQIGKVVDIRLDKNNYKAAVMLIINNSENQIPIDSTASILTQGLLGNSYIGILPGFSNQYMKSGDFINNTKSAIIMDNLIGELLFNINKK